ncbi:MAG: hypothetical protein CMP00_03320 [Woeseiaceae bacterium]|nr:hypothetical protein [Woeseiaceae bacterium]
MNDKTGTTQIHGYNELTQKLFTRAEYCDSKDYFEGELIELKMGDLGLGHLLQLKCFIKGQTISTIRYRVFGCPHFMALVEYFCEEIEGSLINDIAKIDLHEMQIKLAIPTEKTALILLLEDVIDEIRLQCV